MEDTTVLKETVKMCFVLIIIFLLLPVVVNAEGDIVFYDVADGKASIFRINPDGSNLKEVIKDAIYPLWSPDGKMIAFIRVIGETHISLMVSDENGKIVHQIGGMEIKLGGKKPIEKFICSHAWSPDNKCIAFTTGFFMTRELYLEIYDLITKKTRALHQIPVNDIDVACLSQLEWSPDGKKIILAPQGLSDTGEIGAFDIEKNRQEIIAQEGVFSKIWGKYRILFMTLNGNTAAYWSMDLNGQNKELIIKSDKVLIPMSKVNRDKVILQGLFKDGIPGLHILNLKTKDIKKIQVNDYLFLQPEFSPDGDKIIGIGVKISDLSNEGGRYGYYVYDLKTQKMTLLKEIRKDRGQSYWWSVYFGGRKDFSWR